MTSAVSERTCHRLYFGLASSACPACIERPHTSTTAAVVPSRGARAVSVWTFTLAHATLHDVLPLVQAQLAMSRLPYSEREEALQVKALS